MHSLQMRSLPLRWLTAFSLAFALAGTAAAAEIKGASRIDAVTVYPSGAEVVRIAHIKLERGDHTLLLTDLPADAVASSIRVQGKATAGLEIGSVDTRTVSVPRADAAEAASERRRVEEAIEKLRDEKASLQVSVRAAETQKRLIDSLTKLPLFYDGQTARAQANGAPASEPDWGQLLNLVGARAADAEKAILDTKVKVRAIDRQIKDLEGKLASLAPTQVARMEVKVALAAEADLEAEIVVRYQVRHASWTPFYDARLSVGDKAQAPRLHLTRRASIQQRTGEAWDNVVLTLSTTRPTAGTAAPELSPLVIDFEADRPAESMARPVPAPTQPMPKRMRGNAPAAEPDQIVRLDGSAKFESANDRTAAVEVQAFQALYAIAGRTTVPNTGEMKRVQIDAMDLEPKLLARTVPRKDEKAYLYAKIVTAKGAPLLPGQVALFRDNVFVGNGALPLLAPEEEHELGFGIDDAIRVRHAVAEEKRGESGIISTSKTDARSYRISVKNLHERPIDIAVIDQIPVSQNADIAVELTGKSPPTRRDIDHKRGVLAWDMTLAPAEEHVIEFGYRATWPGAKKVTYGQGS
jgi:uncharacterized protein (TIGR02231 family)